MRGIVAGRDVIFATEGVHIVTTTPSPTGSGDQQRLLPAQGGRRSSDELRLIAKRLLEDATPASLVPLFSDIPSTITSAIEELARQPRRARYDERTTFTVSELTNRQRGRQLLIAPRGAGKSFALWHAANTMMTDSSTIPLFLSLGRFESWSEALNHIKLFTPEPDDILKDPRIVVFLDGWSEFARGGGGDSDAHRKVLSALGDLRIVASARQGSEHDARFEITHLEPLPGDAVRRVLRIAFPKAAAPAGALLELLRLPLALMLHLLLGGPAASRGELLAALQQQLSFGLPASLTTAIACAAARTALASETPRRAVFEAELRRAGAEFAISDPIGLTRRLGTFGTSSTDVRPVHDLYWSWLVGIGLIEIGLVAPAIARLDLHESIELAIEAGTRVPQNLVDETRMRDAVLATRLAAAVTVGASAELSAQTQRMLADGRAAMRRRGILAGIRSTNSSLFRSALDALAELRNNGIYIDGFADDLRMDIIWGQRAELAAWIGAKGTEQLLGTIAVRGDSRWVNWLEQLVSSGRLAGKIAGPIAIACSQTIPGWTRPLLANLGDELYRLRHAATRGTNVELARWAAEEYQKFPRSNSDPWMELNNILVQCGDDAVFEGLLRGFDTLSAKAQQTLGYAIVERGEPWISKFQRRAFAAGTWGHSYRLYDHVSSLIDDDTARRWIAEGPVVLGWQVLIKRYGNAVVPEILSRLPQSFSGLHNIPELRALASLDDAPEEIVDELWNRLHGTVMESVLEDMLGALARVRLKGIPSMIARLRFEPFFLPPLSFSRFLVLLAEWEVRMGFVVRASDGLTDRRFSEWIRLVRWEKERNQPLVGHRLHQAALPISDDVLDDWAAGAESLKKFVYLSRPLDRYHAKAVDFLMTQPSGGKEVLVLFGDVLNKFPEAALLRLFEKIKEEGSEGYHRLLRAVAASNEPSHREFHAALVRYFLDQPLLDMHASYVLANVLRVHSTIVLRALLRDAVDVAAGLWLLRDVEQTAGTLLIDEEGQWLPLP
ncbi:hypothetical protein [Sorangium sp. So ce1153]|uniref:hypothetical protein n=1 Tax=Sorangium sp. So ce1153 TaxID=3133333 RepID=UPI003F5F539D